MPDRRALTPEGGGAGRSGGAHTFAVPVDHGESDMKKLKVVVWLLVFGLIALVIFENEEHFLNTQLSLRLNLWRLADYQSPSLPLAVYYILFFAYGLVVAFGFSASARFKLRRTVKRLTATVAGREKEILSLKTELAQLKGEPLPGAGESSITSPIKPA
jgi:uncharacterized integral membrane protein